MKKHNEGYALPFVLVVITVLCLIALAISSVSLRNMQSQQASIQRMQDKYEAQGKIEIVIAQLDNISGKVHVADLETLGDFNGDGDNEVAFTLPDLSGLSEDATSIKVSLKSTVRTAEITCTLLIHSNAIIPTGTGPIIYQLTDPTYEYVSYNISTITAAEEGGGVGA